MKNTFSLNHEEIYEYFNSDSFEASWITMFEARFKIFLTAILFDFYFA